MKQRAFLPAICFLIILLSLCLGTSCAENSTIYWINPDGGSRYHVDQNCPSINPKYLPLSVSITVEDLKKEPYHLLIPCNVCGAAAANENAAINDEALLRLAQLPENPAPALTVEVIWNNVNFRQKPGGKVLGKLQGGTELDILEEKWYQDSLWYHTKTEQYGEGYIQATWAKPIWNGEYFWTRKIDFDATNDDDILTDNMLKYMLDMLQFELDYGFIRLTDNASDGIYAFNLNSQNSCDESMIAPEMKTEYVFILYEDGMICMDKRYDILKGSEKSSQEKASISSDILKTHYGTDNLGVIILQRNAVGFHPSDWHTPEITITTKRDHEAAQAITNEFLRRNK